MKDQKKIPLYEISAQEKFWVPPEKYSDRLVDVGNKLLASKQQKAKEKGEVFLNQIKMWRRNPNFDEFGIKYNDSLRVLQIDTTVRLRGVSAKTLHVEMSNYLDQNATNIECDAKFNLPGKGETCFRSEANDPDGRFLPYETSPLANTIGVCCVFLDKHRVPFFVNRSTSSVNVIKEGGMHCTASGALNWEDLYFDGENASGMGVTAGMQREIFYELGFYPTEYALSCICLAREMARAGKPQLFFVAQFEDLDLRQIQTLHNERRKYIKEKEETLHKEGIRLPLLGKRLQGKTFHTPIENKAIDGYNEKYFSSDAFEKFTYEGWANLFYAFSALVRNK